MSITVELPPSAKSLSISIIDDIKFNIPYISQVYNDTPLFVHLPVHARPNVWIVAIGSEEPIMSDFTSDELRWHTNMFPINTSLEKNFWSVYFQDIWDEFDQVIPIVGYCALLPQKPLTPSDSRNFPSGLHHRHWIYGLFLNMTIMLWKCFHCASPERLGTYRSESTLLCYITKDKMGCQRHV